MSCRSRYFSSLVALLRASRTSATILAIVLALFLSAVPSQASADGLLTKGPFFLEVGSSSVRIAVETPVASEITLSVRAGDGPAQTIVLATESWRRDGRALGSVALESLDPNTRYVVTFEGAGGLAAGSFTTAPETLAADAQTSLSFLVYGDNRTQHAQHQQVVDVMLNEEDIRFLLHTGDMVEMGGRPSDWDTYFQIARGLLSKTPIFPTLGNHELFGPGGRLVYQRHFSERGIRVAYYARSYGPIRVISLDSNDEWASDGPQLTWLRAELDAPPEGTRFTFVVVHHSPVSSGPHGGHEAMQARGVVALLVEGGVDLIVAGHDHMYERGDAEGLKYIVSGGGGAPLYYPNAHLPSQQAFVPIYHYLRVDLEMGPEGDRVSVSAIDADGELIERCGFAPGDPWECENGGVSGPIHDLDDPRQERSVWRSWGSGVFGLLVIAGLWGLWRSRRRKKRAAAEAARVSAGDSEE